ncbi:MAG: hypothetical protein WAO19_07995 [Candidatus Kryptoniota bacterium]
MESIAAAHDKRDKDVSPPGTYPVQIICMSACRKALIGASMNSFQPEADQLQADVARTLYIFHGRAAQSDSRGD